MTTIVTNFSHSRGGYGYGGSSRELEQAQQHIRELEAKLQELNESPRVMATVVEVREKRMGISLGPAQSLDVKRKDGAKVGDRVMLDRNTLQVLEVLAEEDASGHAGTVVTVTKVHQHVVEALLGTDTRTFRLNGMTAKPGERLIIDLSFQFVVGSLGVPPSSFAFSPKVSVAWDDIGGHAVAKEQLREAIELPFAHPELFAAYKKRGVKGVLLSGPPGTGKTMLAKATATSLARTRGAAASTGFIYVKGPELLNMYIGNSEAQVRQLFVSARAHKAQHGYPAVVFVDEADALFRSRDMGTNLGINATVVPQFLAEMDGLDEHAAIFILATNRPDILDAAVVREGRIDRKIQVGRPTQDDARTILEIHLRDRPLHGRGHVSGALKELYSSARVVCEWNGTTLRLGNLVNGAMIAEIVERASTLAMQRDIGAGATEPTGLRTADLIWAIDQTFATAMTMNQQDVLAELIEAQSMPLATTPNDR